MPKTQHLRFSTHATMHAPLPILLPPLPASGRSAQTLVGADPCASLTPEALQQVIDKIAESLAKADSDVTANGTTGSYAPQSTIGTIWLKSIKTCSFSSHG
jgi:hypothetical protein